MMTSNTRLLKLAMASLVLFLLGCAPTPQDSSRVASDTNDAMAVLVPGSGVYSRPTSIASEQAQSFFDQGLRLAWGFYFPESIASYQQAAVLAPDSPMPYWGMAHAIGPNPNSRYARMPDDPLGEGLKAIKKARSLSGNANVKEQAMIESLYVLYDKGSIADHSERDQAYLASARALHQQYPADPDIAALYAAAYMSIGRWDYWDTEGLPKSETLPVAEALESVLETTPGHPGANHLHIHLLEASMEPERALASADRLEATMPIAGHVVHMPAHIYVRVGQYQKAIDNNVRSQAVDKEFAAIWGELPLPNIGTYPLSHKMHAPHAQDFIRYAATVQGNYAVAIAAALKSAASVTPDSFARNQKRIAAPWLVYKIFGKWQALLDLSPNTHGAAYLEGIWLYTSGSAHIATGQLEIARRKLEQLQTLVAAPDADEYRVGATPASAVLKLAALGLAGELHEASGDLSAAIVAYRQASELEDLNNYTEPPDWAQPIRQYLGAALLADGQGEAAEAVYRRDLRWNQNNGWALFGLYQSLTMQNDPQAAAQILLRYRSAWQNADVELKRSRL